MRPGLPSIQQHPHQLALPQPPLSSHSTMNRPSLDRAHTFPTPPTSSSAVMGNMGSSEGFNWQGQGMNGAQGNNPMSIDTGISNTRSMPNTPATTPPGPSIQNMQPYPSAAQGYDGQRQMYNAPATQQSPYQTSANPPQDRMYGQSAPYQKSDMGPPSSRPQASGPGEQQESKPSNGVMPSESATQSQSADDDNDHEHEAEYTHDSGAYDHTRAPYSYANSGVGSMANDNNLSPEMTGSPNHPPTSGRATPRTAATPQSFYQQHNGGYNTPPRVQQSSSNLYNVMTNDRAPSNGASGNDVYAPQADMNSSMPNGYSTQSSGMNGSVPGMKRGRDDDDDLSRPIGDGPGSMGGLDLKRRKTMDSVPAPSYDAMSRPTSAIAAPRRR